MPKRSSGPVRARGKPKVPRVRKPTDAQVKDELCRRLIEGESLRSICALSGMPSKSTICRWLASDAKFQRQYAAAREMQGEALAEEILSIADTPVIGKKTVSKPTGDETTEGDMIEHRRLQVDARKWLASKLFPKKYGEAAMLKLADADGQRLQEVDDVTRVTRLAAMAMALREKAADAAD